MGSTGSNNFSLFVNSITALRSFCLRDKSPNSRAAFPTCRSKGIY